MRGRGRRLGLCLAVAVLLGGCGSEGPGDTSAFSDQRATLERAWWQGWEARASLDLYGHDPQREITAQMCATFYDATDASDVGRSERYKALAKVFFIKGCMGQPNPPPSTIRP